ncbi:NAD(P)-dependent dehydrogenase (short-subunit alcohol dehydrogenase family) [Neobacillus niacini]|jgi:NAD(P)-dependent dehydrogenase (short-subunit alcohol dehydrogenase family)|uniref:SDR family NAD(P)-dependent oxidoreductase n=1 Tax=Neobacillus niacini TaxID=86668 RepID=UPI00278A27B5|nr:SDR family NAD(P)-dependent oxidoreductase [Neobacillus niacini]MDQ1002040.1 NAD(P)-dependent dehydrogenase (short-subunit alcohol dehydrogenase family) [Neobacillus niacini]
MTFPLLEGKVAIVTGAAMGMGEATAKLFAEAKAKVVIADFNEEKGRAVTDAINSSGGEAAFVKVDISKSEEVQKMIKFAVDTFGKLDVAVNNAALTPDDKPAAEFDEAYWNRLISVDLTGTALCMKYELQQMQKQGHGGSIINISSVSGFRPQPNNIAYVAAKHGVVGMTKVAAMENGPLNIRVNSVAPGAIDTPMLRGALEQFGLTEEAYAPQLSLLNRFGQPREIAQASLWLASDASSYVTGTTLHVDAGYTSR